MKSTFIVYRLDRFEPENEVYFHYSFDDAVRSMDERNQEDDVWGVAQIMDERSWHDRFCFWLARLGA